MTDALDYEPDELYDEAARLVVAEQSASISLIQRRLRIGFSRAYHLIDMMAADGLVTGSSDGRMRSVLVGRDYFEQVDKQLQQAKADD